MDEISLVHIPLNARVALFLRYRSFQLKQAEADYFESTSGSLSPQDALQARKSFGSLHQGLEHTIDNLFEDRAWNDPLDLSIERISENFQEERRTLERLLGKPNDCGSPIIETFQGVNCGACKNAAGVDHVCRGDLLTDSELVARKGLCFRWILDIADYVSAYAKEAYSPVAARLGLALPESAFCTGLRLLPRPHGLNHDAQLAAKTNFEYGASGRSVITLFLSNRFDLSSWLVVLYVLFHEYICHAYQALSKDPLSKRERSSDSRFAEGWMDAVAARLARSEIESPSKAFPLSLIPYKQRLLAEVQSLFAARYASDAPENPNRRLTGVRAYERLEICFWYHCGVPGMTDAVSFSFALNVAATDDQLEQITTLILKIVPYGPEVRGFDSRSRAAWQAARNFLDHREILQLIVELTRESNELSAI